MSAAKFTYSTVSARGVRTHYPLRVKRIAAANDTVVNDFLAEGEAWRRTLVDVVMDTRNGAMWLFYVEQVEEEYRGRTIGS